MRRRPSSQQLQPQDELPQELPPHPLRQGSAASSMTRSRISTLQQALAPLISALFARVNPIPVKAAAAILGLCENNVRLPLVAMRPEETGGLRELLAELAC